MPAHHLIRSSLWPLVGVLALTGCERAGPVPMSLEAPAQKMAARFSADATSLVQTNRPANSTLAYEHDVTVRLAVDVLLQRVRELTTACTPDGEYKCTLLDVTDNTSGEVPSASLRMRLAPSAVGPLVALAGKDGRIVHRSTHAEDLAEPIADSERQLALLTTHRDRLTEILKARDLKVEQLITVSRELSSVQVQIDSAATQRANLRRRVGTDLLTLQLTPPDQAYAGQETPVRDALRGFIATMARAAGGVISFVAALVPWALVLVPSLFGLRALWRRRRTASR